MESCAAAGCGSGQADVGNQQENHAPSDFCRMRSIRKSLLLAQRAHFNAFQHTAPNVTHTQLNSSQQQLGLCGRLMSAL